MENLLRAKSPDTNVLDLLFFRALQAKQWSLGSETTLDGLLIAQVVQVFAEFEPRKIDCGSLRLQTFLNDMLQNSAYGKTKLCFVNFDIYRAAFRRLLKRCKPIKC